VPPRVEATAEDDWILKDPRFLAMAAERNAMADLFREAQVQCVHLEEKARGLEAQIKAHSKSNSSKANLQGILQGAARALPQGTAKRARHAPPPWGIALAREEEGTFGHHPHSGRGQEEDSAGEATSVVGNASHQKFVPVLHLPLIAFAEDYVDEVLLSLEECQGASDRAQTLPRPSPFTFSKGYLTGGLGFARAALEGGKEVYGEARGGLEEPELDGSAEGFEALVAALEEDSLHHEYVSGTNLDYA